jgi:hypothetical protein
MASLDFLTRHLEWEAVSFPVTLTQIEFEDGFLPAGSGYSITLWRNYNYELTGSITGYTLDIGSLRETKPPVEGNILKGHCVSGKDEVGNLFALSECYITFFSVQGVQNSDGEYGFEGRMSLDDCTVTFYNSATKGEDKVLYWYLSGDSPAWMSGITVQKPSSPNPKMRRGFDEFDDSAENILGSYSSKDFMSFLVNGFRCFVAKVPKDLLPDWAYGYCIEFRDDAINGVSDKEREAIENFLSFLFGTELKQVGSSILKNNVLAKCRLLNDTAISSTAFKQPPFPPIAFNRQYEWGNPIWLVERLLPAYLNLYESLPMREILSRYFMALRLPVGINLPLFANALEILVEDYLTYKGGYVKQYVPDNEFTDLIAEELKAIQKKLSGVVDSNVVLNKIKTANRKVPAEKMNSFFSVCGIIIGRKEKKAMQLRNVMTHSKRDYREEKNAHEDVIHTRVYQSLINRILLHLMGYDEYYIDYSLSATTVKKVSKNAGKD